LLELGENRGRANFRSWHEMNRNRGLRRAGCAFERCASRDQCAANECQRNPR
jgi:hypothetical protein